MGPSLNEAADDLLEASPVAARPRRLLPCLSPTHGGQGGKIIGRVLDVEGSHTSRGVRAQALIVWLAPLAATRSKEPCRGRRTGWPSRSPLSGEVFGVRSAEDAPTGGGGQPARGPVEARLDSTGLGMVLLPVDPALWAAEGGAQSAPTRSH